MEDMFWRILTATVAGNMLTVWFLYSVYCLTKAEKRQEEGRLIWWGGMLAPSAIIVGGIYLFSSGA